MELKNMSLAELNELKKKLEAEKEEIHEQLRAISRAIEGKQAEKAIADKIAGMSDSEKKAMAQALQAEGIKSGEKVGTPGF